MLKRFMDKVAKTDTCWIWTGARSDNRYGYFWNGHNNVLAHRQSYEMFNGELVPELVVMHTCDNPACVNPAHLKLGTQSDNRIDCLNKGRGNVANGERKPNSRLTADIVRDIRKSPLTSVELSVIYGVSDRTIADARRGDTWKHVK